MECPNCGKEIDDDSKFCPECGEETILVNETEKEPFSTDKMKNINVKKIVIFAVVALLLICGIAYYIMMRPLNYTYKSAKYGDFYVNSEISDNHTFLVKLESVYPLEEWRFNCMLIASMVVDRSELQPKLVSSKGIMPIMLESNIVANKPVVLVLNIRTKVNSPFEYQKAKTSAKKLLDLYELELPMMLLKEGAEGYDKMNKICSYVK